MSLPDAAELQAQRWFGAKGAAISRIELEDELELGGGAGLAVLGVETEDGVAHRYLHLRGQERVGAAVLDALAAGEQRGSFEFHPGSRLAELMPTGREERPIGVDQSNTSIVVGERLVVKLYRRLMPGVHPEIELGAHLTEHAQLAFVPAFAGSLHWGDHALGLVQEYVPGSLDGWAWGGRMVVRGEVDELRTLGRHSGGLHAALARFASRSAEPSQLAAWRAAAEAQLDRVLGLLSGTAREELARFAPRIRDELAGLERPERPPLLTRVHGDYHIGQILHSPSGMRVVDLEGEPTKSLAERAALDTPLRDVAAMLRSFDHLGRHVDREVWPGHTEQIEAWIGRAREAFLAGYGDVDATLVRALEVEKETYEFVYAATFLPGWTYAALGGMRWLMRTAP